ncbi:MAG: hypothetical protein GWO40_04630, partial [Gammaproteobacteria bacterium]|nr:hypothetical protein [Gammaproteobacteria bacterium]NIX84846.1 hypothetical protein [Gammaproteobacteria bacterium]
ERFVSFGLLRFTAWEAAFLHSRKGIIDEEMWIAWDGGSRILVAGPGFARFWNEAASAFAPSFRRYIEVEVFRETKSG